MTTSTSASTPVAQNLASAGNKAGEWLRAVPVKRWRLLVLLLLALWITHNLARLFWVVVPVPSQPVAPVVPTSVDGTVQASLKTVDLSSVNDLFGKYDPDAEAKRLAAEEALRRQEEQSKPVEETKLNLKLQGVIESNDPEKSWAIIGEASSQQLYKIGDMIPGVRNVKVKDIAALWVILDNNGKSERLWLYGEDGNKVAVARPTPPPPPPRDEPADDGVEKREVSQEEISKVKSIGDVVRFMVATENGQMIGYKVRPGRKRELFDQVGLKNEDIVTSVNGIEVNEPQKVREVYQALKTATEANLEVLRDGSTQFIQISLSSD